MISTHDRYFRFRYSASRRFHQNRAKHGAPIWGRGCPAPYIMEPISTLNGTMYSKLLRVWTWRIFHRIFKVRLPQYDFQPSVKFVWPGLEAPFCTFPKLLLLLLLQNLYSAHIQASSSQRRWRIARWGTWLAGVGKEVSFETALKRANG